MKKRGAGACCDAVQTDKASDRDCGRGCIGQKGLLLSTINKNTYSKTQYFVREVKGRRMTKNGVEFLIGWRDFPLDKDDTWEPITNLRGSEHMIAEFQDIGKNSTKSKRQSNFNQ